MSSPKKCRKSTPAARSSSTNSNSDNESGTSNRGDNNSLEESEEFEPGSWECTVCTFRNKYEAFKCLICDTRKGTSTRKPRLNPSVVQQQTLVQKMAVEVELKQLKKQRTNSEARNSPDLFAPVVASSSSQAEPAPPVSSPANGKSSSSSNNGNNSKVPPLPSSSGGKSILLMKRRPIPFRDALVVRSSAKKSVVNVEGRNFTIVEFKPRISPRGRKKGSVNNKDREKATTTTTNGTPSGGGSNGNDGSGEGSSTAGAATATATALPQTSTSTPVKSPPVIPSLPLHPP